MDILMPLVLGALVAGIIWMVASSLDKKLQKKLSLADGADKHGLYPKGED